MKYKPGNYLVYGPTNIRVRVISNTIGQYFKAVHVNHWDKRKRVPRLFIKHKNWKYVMKGV